MIKIDISDKKMKEIENKHWRWFKNKKVKIEKEEPQIELTDWFKKEFNLDQDDLEEIIIGKIDTLKKWKEKLGRIEKNKYEKLKNWYKNFRSLKVKEWDGVKLCHDLELAVCPYCNRSFIVNYIDKEGKKTHAELDHFYSKDEYPYLALSLYNLIPVCHSCNHIKSNSDSSIVYPYDEEFGDNGKFTIRLSNSKDIRETIDKEYDSDVFFGNSDNFLIDFNITNDKDKKIKTSIEKFKLREVYQFHRDYVRELIKKAIIYNDSQIDELYREYEGTLFSSREDVISMIVSNYVDENDLGKRVLAKLTKDIGEELGLVDG